MLRLTIWIAGARFNPSGWQKPPKIKREAGVGSTNEARGKASVRRVRYASQAGFRPKTVDRGGGVEKNEVSLRFKNLKINK